jgi:hypothetical protein
MNYSRCLAVAALALLLPALLGCSSTREVDAAADQSDDQAVLRVTSTDPDSPVVFDADFEGVTELNIERVTARETPFEMRVSADDFVGVFRKVSGSGDMHVVVFSEVPAGNEGWFHLSNRTPTIRVALTPERNTIGSL